MSEKNPKNYSEILMPLGFTSSNRQNWSLWTYYQPGESAEGKKLRDSFSNPWIIQDLQLAVRKELLKAHQCILQIDVKQLIKNLEKTTKKFFGPRTQGEFVETSNTGLWCLFEFSRAGKGHKNTTPPKKTDNETQMPHGIGGFRVRFLIEGNVVKILFSDHFGIGFAPALLATKTHQFIHHGLCLPKTDSTSSSAHTQQPNLFEFAFNVYVPAIHKLLQSQTAPGKDICHELVSEISKDATQTNSTLYKQESNWTMAAPGVPDSGQSILDGYSFLPTEVLETRELVHKFQEIEDYILAGKSRKASLILKEQLRENENELFLVRRASLLVATGQRLEIANSVNEALEQEPQCTLFLSAAIAIALNSGDQSKALKGLSELGALLTKIIPNANNVRTFDIVFPELLGDAWRQEDRNRAEACYKRILQKRGDLPRILRKLISLAKANNDEDVEFELSERLAIVERRRVELAKIYFRLAELQLRHPSQQDTAIKLAIKSLEYDQNHHASALLAAELLSETERPQEAIGLLDGLLKSSKIAISNKAKSQLHRRIGDLWLYKLQREKLAESRYEEATSLDPSNFAATEALEKIYRKHGNLSSLVNILERKFDLLEKQDNSHGLNVLFEELVEIYRGVLGEPNRAYDLYQRLLANSSIEPEEVERILSWREVEVDWTDLYKKLNSKCCSIEDASRRARFHSRLSDICRTKLIDHRKAQRHLCEALKCGHIEPDGFNYLVEKLSENGDTESLIKIYEQRLDLCTDAKERKELISQALSLPAGMSDKRRDILALESYLIDQGSERFLQKRFSYYQAMGDTTSILNLLNLITSQEISTFLKNKWANWTVEILKGAISDDKPAALNGVYLKLIETCEDPIQVAEDAIETLTELGNTTHLKYFVSELLYNSVLPNLNDRDIQKCLKGESLELAKFHKLKSEASSSSVEATEHARTAVAIYSKFEEYNSTTEYLLGNIGSKGPCSEDELQSLVSLVEDSGKWLMLSSVLECQVSLEDEMSRKLLLLEHLGNTYIDKLDDLERGKNVLLELLKHTIRPTDVYWKMALISQKQDEPKQELSWLNKFIMDARSMQDESLVKRAVGRLLELNSPSKPIRKLLLERADDAIASADYKLGASLCEVLIENGIESTEAYQTIFATHLQYKRYDEALSVWWKALSCVKSKIHVRQFLKENTASMKKLDPKLIIDCLDRSVIENAAANLSSNIQREILIFHGEQIFELEDKRHQALNLFQKAFILEPNDHRVWMPMYFLLGEFGSPSERFQHLKHIVPKLKTDERPLREFPLTIESLQAELDELSSDDGILDRRSEDEIAEKQESISKIQFVDQTNTTATNTEVETETGLDVEEMDKEEIDLLNEHNFASHNLVSQSDPTIPSFDRSSAEGFDIDSPAMQIPIADPMDISPPQNIAVAHHDSDSEENSKVKDVGLQNPINLNFEPSTSNEPIAPGLPSLDFSIPPTDGIHEPDDSHSEPVQVGIISDSSTTEEGAAVLDLFNTFTENAPILLDIEAATEVSAIKLGSSEDLNSDSDSGFKIEIPNLDGLEDEINEIAEGQSEANSEPSAPQINLDLTSDTSDEHVSMSLGVNQIDSAKSAPSVLSQESTLEMNELGGTEVELPTEEPEPKHDAGDDAKSNDGETSEAEVSTTDSTKEEKKSAFNNTEESDLTHDLEPSNFGSDETSVEPSATENTLVEENLDWRKSIIDGDFRSDLTQKIMAQAFTSETEKHVAIQAVALIAGNCELLNNWHWRVWRNTEEYGYPINGKGRYPSGQSPASLHSALYKYILTLAPVFVKVHMKKFTLEETAKRLQIKTEQIEKIAQPLDWNSGFLKEAGFGHYAKRIAHRKYKIFNLPGLNKGIVYVGSSRSFYFDKSYYSQKSPNHLFHKVVRKMWSIQLRYFVPMSLHPEKEIMPILADVHEYFGSNGITKIKSILGGNTLTQKALQKIDPQKVRSLHRKVGMPEPQKVTELFGAMEQHLNRLILAETLDAIGLFESICGRNLLKPDLLKHSEIYNLNSEFGNLIRFLTSLDL